MLKEHTFRKLLIWQKSMSYITDVNDEVKNFPSEELYALSSQIKRSAISIPSNIAEGYGRVGKKDYVRFLNISLSSLFELQTQLEIAYNLKYLNTNSFVKLYENSREIERMLTSFIRKIKT